MAKTTRDLICITCPRGCAMKITLEDGKVTEVVGNACPRGVAYAEAECTHPTRTLTTTVALSGGGVLPVKTDRPIPKELLFAAMEEINRLSVPRTVKVGDVLVESFLGTEANLIATADAK